MEVITPAGNFSSYPPHKHDTFDPDLPEVELEEIYYFRFSGDNGYGLFREWATDGEFDTTMIVRDGDTVLCPYGYTARRLRCRATTCTSSTSWQGREPSESGRHPTIRHRRGFVTHGRIRNRIHVCP